jgi:hypothetical protein
VLSCVQPATACKPAQRIPREGRGVRPRLVHLKFIVGPDDNGRPCITVMMPGED